jgi:hypothetical protein
LRNGFSRKNFQDSATRLSITLGFDKFTSGMEKNHVSMHQSFMEYSGQSILHCAWAKAFYRMQRKKGKGHWAAVRALAYKWVRIIFACWKNKVVYDDARYMQSLRKSKSPLISLMEEAAETAIAN